MLPNTKARAKGEWRIANGESEIIVTAASIAL
jgi:hypothetical protein